MIVSEADCSNIVLYSQPLFFCYLQRCLVGFKALKSRVQQNDRNWTHNGTLSNNRTSYFSQSKLQPKLLMI